MIRPRSPGSSRPTTSPDVQVSEWLTAALVYIGSPCNCPLPTPRASKQPADDAVEQPADDAGASSAVAAPAEGVSVGDMVEAVEAFKGEAGDELSFLPGELIKVVSMPADDPDW